MKNFRRIMVMLVAALTIGGALYADSETRRKTEVEKRFFSEVIQTCQTAVAGIKITWDEDGRCGDKAEDSINVDSEKHPLVHYFNVSWADYQCINDAKIKTETELAAKAPELQKQIEGSDTKAYEAMIEKIGKTAEAGDFAEVERLQKEVEAMAKKLEESYKPMNQGIDAIIEKNTPKDTKLKVSIAINKFYESFSQKAQTGKLANGMPYYRVGDGSNRNSGWTEGTTFVFLGNEWKSGQDEEPSIMKHPEHIEKPSASVRAIVIAVEAEAKRALATLNSMDLNALKALIK